MSGKIVNVALCDKHKKDLNDLEQGWRIANLGIEHNSIPNEQFANGVRLRFAQEVDECKDCVTKEEEHHLEGPVGEAS